jgi:hypothetical protein
VELTRIERQYVDIDVDATLPDGTPATLTGVDVALLPPRTSPAAGTTWTAATYALGVASVLLAGPDAAGSGALVVPATGADLWIRVTDAPEIDAAKITRIAIV